MKKKAAPEGAAKFREETPRKGGGFAGNAIPRCSNMPKSDEFHKSKLRPGKIFFLGNIEFSVTFLPLLNHLSDAAVIVRRKIIRLNPGAGAGS